jgi:hypothetical protein
MTKINIQRTFDPSKVYETDAGKQLKDFIDSQLQVNELSLRTLRGGISFEDNMYCLVRDLELKHAEPQVIGSDKKVSLMFAGRVFSTEFYLTAPLQWYYNDQGQLEVVARFSGTPTVALKVRTVILFE